MDKSKQPPVVNSNKNKKKKIHLTTQHVISYG